MRQSSTRVMNAGRQESARNSLTKAFRWIEDIVYVGLGALLAGCALTLLATDGLAFWRILLAGSLSANLVQLLDHLLLVLLIVELMYTVQVSFREHTLAPEPFLIVGLIAVVRRLLLLTAELPHLQSDSTILRQVSIELGLLALLIVALVASVVLLRRRPLEAVADRG